MLSKQARPTWPCETQARVQETRDLHIEALPTSRHRTAGTIQGQMRGHQGFEALGAWDPVHPTQAPPRQGGEGKDLDGVGWGWDRILVGAGGNSPCSEVLSLCHCTGSWGSRELTSQGGEQARWEAGGSSWCEPPTKHSPLNRGALPSLWGPPAVSPPTALLEQGSGRACQEGLAFYSLSRIGQ